MMLILYHFEDQINYYFFLKKYANSYGGQIASNTVIGLIAGS
jgi:hypothetical protein